MRIQPKALRDYPWYIRPLFWLQRKNYGTVLTSSLLWARSPRVFFGLSIFFGALDRKTSPISPSLRSLVIVKVSQLNGCEFCVDLNASLLLKRGVDESKLKALVNWKESSLLSKQEKVVLEYVEAITLSDLQVDDPLMSRLQREFSDDEVIELTAIIAFQNMSTKFNTALDVPPQGFCILP